jgi:hypothetical protein
LHLAIKKQKAGAYNGESGQCAASRTERVGLESEMADETRRNVARPEHVTGWRNVRVDTEQLALRCSGNITEYNIGAPDGSEPSIDGLVTVSSAR